MDLEEIKCLFKGKSEEEKKWFGSGGVRVVA